MKKSIRHARFRLIVILLLSVLFAGCKGGGEEEPLGAAEIYFSEGRYLKAADTCAIFLKDHPESKSAPECQYLLARAYFHLDDMERAVDAYAALFYLYPESLELTPAAKDMAAIYSSRGEHWRAVEQYKWLKGRVKGEELSRVSFMMGKALLGMNDFAGARKEFDALLQKTTDQALAPELHYMIATTHALEEKHEEAVDSYECVISGYPKGRFVHDSMLGKAASLDSLGRLEESLEILRALKGEYHNPEALEVRIEWVEKRIAKRE